MTRRPSGAQSNPPIALLSSASYSFRACSPSDRISQISLSPKATLFVPKEIVEPSREMEYAYASSRSLRITSSETDTDQTLVPRELQLSVPSPIGWALARKFLPLGNHAKTSQSTFSS